MMRRWIERALVVLATLGGMPDASAQVRNRPLASASAATVSVAGVPQYHVVQRGETLGVIAAHYGVTLTRLAERNHLAAPYALRNGQRLRLPAPTMAPAQTVAMPTPAVRPAAAVAARPTPPPARPTPARPAAPAASNSRYGRNRHPGVVVMRRLAFDESLTANLRRLGRATQATMRRFLRATNGASHTIDGRLLRQLATVSDHFGGRQVEVISGFRPFRRGQATPHSNHNVGRAVDFRVVGVRNRAVYDFCRTLPATGCGFYPRSVFIHMDTRSESATWVDWSRPGERPRYGTMARPPAPRTPAVAAAPTMPAESTPPPAGADAELDDVADDHPPIRSATPEPDDGNDVTDSLPTGQ